MLDKVKKNYSPLAPQDMTDELFWKDGLSPNDERLWVPNGPGRWSRPLCLNVSQGYWVHITKVTEAGIVSRHRHPAPVHGFVIEGKWRYLERDWEATAGSYLYEPPGDVHTLVVDEGESMKTLFIIPAHYYTVMKMEKRLALRTYLIVYKQLEIISKTWGLEATL